MKKIGIVGFGRFGELLARLSAGVFDVHIVESNPQHKSTAAENYTVIPFESLIDMDYIYLAVPISKIEDVLMQLAPIVTENQVVIDLCSVKVYPVQLMKKYLHHVQILGSHPLFGPDSAKKGLQGLQVAICPINISDDNLQILTDFWTNQGVVILQTTPEDHDKDSVYSQAFTYAVARIINNMQLPDITFTTRSYKAITEVANLSANDTDQLFHDMFFYNPYFRQMKAQLEQSITTTDIILNEIEAEQSAAKPF